MNTFSVLVVDDERISRQTTAQQLREAGFEAATAVGGAEGMDLLGRRHFDVVLTDLRLPGMDGIEFLRRVRGAFPEVDVIVMTAYGTVETAVEAMQLGAADYVTKPFRFQELLARFHKLAEVRRSRGELGRLRALLDAGGGGCPGIVGDSPAIRKVCDRIRLFADHRAPVLVRGETGTGKEVVARAIHEMGPRRGGPFVAIGCAAIPRDLAESHLFGHERGSFTGASQRRKGCFEQAHGGTLLLDDVDDLPIEIQGKLLRVLQEGTLTRVGGDQVVSADVRVLATTKIDLARAAREGRFREDLFYRLRGLEVVLPPLREREDDVLLLAQHFLRLIASQEGRPSKVLSPEVAAVLRAHSWPGNVRELRRVMESAVAFCRGDVILPSHLPDHLREAAAGVPAGGMFTLRLEGRASVPFHDLVQEFENEVIAWAMRQAGGSQTRAAEILGIPRTTLQSKLRSY